MGISRRNRDARSDLDTWNSRVLGPLLLVMLLLGSVLMTAPASLAAVRQEDDVAAGEPDIAASNAVVLAEPGAIVLFDRDMRARVAPASLTKIMTARVALQRAGPTEKLRVTKDDLVGQASMGLWAGQTLPLETLLYGLLLPSGNDAAMTIARELGARDGAGAPGEAVARFVGWMNEEATRLGLQDTHFVNPHGLDTAGHYSSAYDLARLTLAAWEDQRLARIAGSTAYTGAGHALRHGHALVGRYPGVLGGKTGRTRGCRSCLMTVAERDGRRLAVVVLRDTREQVVADTTTLLEWGFTRPLVAATPTRPPPPTATVPPTPLPPTPTAVPPAPTSTPATIAEGQALPTTTAPSSVSPSLTPVTSAPVPILTPELVGAGDGGAGLTAASTPLVRQEPAPAPSNVDASSRADPWPWWLLLPVLATLAVAGGLRRRRRLPGGGA